MFQYKTFEHQTALTFEEFDTIEGERRFYLTPEGQFPSMTTILSSFKDKSGLDAWRTRIGHEEADRIVKESIDRGNSLHYICEQYLNNDLKPSDLSGAGKILFNRAKPFLDTIQLVVGTEICLYHGELKYAGRTDAIAFMDDQLTILDHKNSRRKVVMTKKWDSVKIHSYQLQCVGYALALDYMCGMKPTQGCLIVSNQEKSSSQVIKFPICEFESEFIELIGKYYESH